MRTHLSQWTGRQLVLLRDGATRAAAAAAVLRQVAGVRLSWGPDRPVTLGPGEGRLFERLGAALLNCDPDQVRALRLKRDRLGLIVEPERRVRACGVLTGAPMSDGDRTTWGLEATRVPSSPYTGRGIRVAVLDTGLDTGHPDLVERLVAAHSFIDGCPVEDGNGHGTFCAGVVAGPEDPAGAPRYGIAPAAGLCVARVLDDNADGTDGAVLAGIDWAVRNECAVASLSVGAPVQIGDAHQEIYEQVASRALAAGTLLIAPAGNTSQRPDYIMPVEHPANCPSIVAVGALDQSLAVAAFSNGGLNSGGGAVDLAAPGIAIVSAAPRPTLHQTGSGTSMAAPFAAGIAALLAEAHRGVRGAALRTLLLESLLPLPSPTRDVGAGLVQAPR